MGEQLHSLRFKKGGVELELTGTRDDVMGAWQKLEGAAVEAFASESSRPEPAPSTGSSTQGSKTPERKPRKKTTRTRASSGESKREDNLSKLLAAQVDEFPEVGDSPTALYAGYATLRWAKDSLGIDGLTAKEIQTFLQQKLRIKNSPNAYRLAFSGQPRAVDASDDYPAVFRLMRPGETALDVYLKKVAKGASAAEAQAAGDEAEREATAE